jgi:flotillin
MDITSIAAHQAEGWRAGRPPEDPAKLRRWGIITARPSEFLIHCRRGRVLGTSGQGASCFKWPWDSVAVVPTSLQKVRFVADQITRERVGVGISGLAVYRIAEPLLAFRVLNFSFPERAQQKLDQTLTEMLIGATRRLVANLTVDECLQKRKAALGDELLRELEPVLGGAGRPEDTTDRGWGVVLDTVEIQEVRILSERVFEAMQAPFRAALDRESREARAEADRRSSLAEAAARQDVATAALESDAAVRTRRAELEREQSEAQARDALGRMELELESARAEIAAHEQLLQARELAAARERLDWVTEGERRRAAGATDLEIGRAEAEVALARARAEAESATAQARLVTAHKLPELAAAVGARFGEIKITQIGAGPESPFGSIAQAVAGVLAMAER